MISDIRTLKRPNPSPNLCQKGFVLFRDFLFVLLLAPSLLSAADTTAIPASFPRFDVPGHEHQVAFAIHFSNSCRCTGFLENEYAHALIIA